MNPLHFDLTCCVDRFDLQVAAEIPAGITGVFGPSGSGKTTLLHTLAGFRRAEQGFVRLGGRTLLDTTRSIDLPPEAREVGVVFQDGRLFPHLSVRGNLRFARPPRDRANAPTFDEVISLLELAPLLSRPTARLSGGERQRVALGRALLAGPQALLLDEPLASLDRPRREAILPYLRRLPARFGIPVLHVTHDLAELLALTDRLLLISQGRLIASGDYRTVALSEAWSRLGVGGEVPGLSNVLTGTVVGREGGVARIALDGDGHRREGGAELLAVAPPRSSGDRVTLTIGAEEIALAEGPIGRTSIRNQLAAAVDRRHDEGGRSTIELRLAPGIALIVEITKDSADRLGLRVGSKVTALIKASAVHLAPL